MYSFNNQSPGGRPIGTRPINTKRTKTITKIIAPIIISPPFTVRYVICALKTFDVTTVMLKYDVLFDRGKYCCLKPNSQGYSKPLNERKSLDLSNKRLTRIKGRAS